MKNGSALALAVAAWLVAAPGAPSHAREGRLALFYGAEDARGAPREDWRRRVLRARVNYEAYAANAVQIYLSYNKNPAPERKAMRVTSIMRDPTLREGDIYAAADGFMIFRGRVAETHAPTDFGPMPRERARRLSLAIDLPR